MARAEHGEPDEPAGRFADDLIGLDPYDPEAQEFAAHLDRIQQCDSRSTVEGMLRGVGDFAHSTNRLRGERRLVAVFLVVLMLFGVGFTVWNALVYMTATFTG
ncbi:hypothetical protein FHR84_000134 [Actinopolyspora biskrensis]|uniref:Uncharacterized protein n=1 Tax=Actinopolyspora biskrensis TaxID=1470178 RepID=A0A852YRT2_9ACTN|nr:hypothetical protein [Actinopolyspora biskrensis]NYH76820.1 hypothetical protein [Actinopolyspora biskrensis]